MTPQQGARLNRIEKTFWAHRGRLAQSAVRTLAMVATLALSSPSALAQDAPYEGKMLRLAEIIGSLHYLTNLCGEHSSEWRDRMDAIIAAEKPDENERLQIVASFNRGYRTFSDNYTRCTDSARTATDRYLKEGDNLSRELISRYGN